jgi:hypothetical protein
LGQPFEALLGKKMPVARAVKSTPIPMAKHSRVETLIVWSLDDDGAVWSEEFSNFSQHTAGILHMLYQIEKQNEVKGRGCRELLDGPIEELMSMRSRDRRRVVADVDDLGSRHSGVNGPNQIKEPAGTTADI